MSLESGVYISDLVATNPTSSDPKSQGDDHLRFVKSTIKATWPNITGAVTPTHTELNFVDGVTSAIQTQIDTKGAITGQTWTGTHTFPATAYGVTASLGDSSTKLATTAFVATTAFSSALPAQTSHSGEIVTTNGTDASWTPVKTINGTSLLAAGDITMPMVLLATLTPTAAANVDSLSSFTGDYNTYKIIGEGICGNLSEALVIRFAAAGVADTGSVYRRGSEFADAGAATTSMALTIQNILTSGVGCNFELIIQNANSTSTIKSILITSHMQDAASAYGVGFGHGVYTAANVISGIRFYWSAGTTFKAQGNIRIYGIRNT